MKIINLSRKLKFFLKLTMLGLPIVHLLYWMFVSEQNLSTALLSSMPLDSIHLSLLNRIMGYIISLVPVSMVLYILLQLCKIFDNYEKQQIFCLDNARRYKKLGVTLFGLALANFLTDAILSVVMSWQNAPTERYLAVGFGAGQIYPIIFGLSIYVISFIMYEAHVMEKEQKYTI